MADIPELRPRFEGRLSDKRFALQRWYTQRLLWLFGGTNVVVMILIVWCVWLDERHRRYVGSVLAESESLSEAVQVGLIGEPRVTSTVLLALVSAVVVQLGTVYVVSARWLFNDASDIDEEGST